MKVVRKAYEEIIDVFARGAASDEVLAFHPSQETQEHVRYLLEKNKTDELTKEEAAELSRYGELEHLMQLVKARARLNVQSKQ